MGRPKIHPDYLKPGDEVAIISPSFVIDEEKIAGAVTLLESWGLKVHTGRNILRSDGPFAGSDQERLADLQEMTDNRQIKAVFCSRGGYGMSRIIEKADFSALRRNPKWYIGFSDITVLHLWLSEVVGMISIHAEMPLNYKNREKSPETFDTLRQSVFGNELVIRWKGESHRCRDVKGEVTGGNLSLLYSLAGTPADPDTNGKILIIEEIGEKYYHLDRMMVSLRLAGKLKGLKALIAGGLNEMEDGKIAWGKSAEQTVLDAVSDYNYPVFFNFPAGHISDNRAFYIGKQARLTGDGGVSELKYL